MTIETISSFIYLYRYQNFQKAAAALHLTQPSLSSRIKSLEDELGTTLFIRNRKGVELTESGQTFLPFAFRIVETYQQAKIALQKKKGSLCIGSSVYATLINKIISPLKKDCSTSITLKTGSNSTVMDLLMNDEIDFAFSQKINHPAIAQTFLFQDPIILVSSAQHHFAQRKRPISLEELSMETFVVYQIDCDYWKEIESIFSAKNLRLNHLIESDSFAISRHMILQNDAIGFLPESPLHEDLISGTLYRIPVFPQIDVSRNTYVTYRKNISDSTMEYVTTLCNQFLSSVSFTSHENN